MTKFYVLVEEGSLSEPADLSNAIVIAKGSTQQPIVSPDGLTLYAIQGTIVSKPEALTLVELAPGSLAPRFAACGAVV